MKFKRLPEAKQQFGFSSDEAFYDQIRRGLMPQGVNISTRAKAWPDFELDQVFNARVAGYTDDRLRQLVQQILAARHEMLPEGFVPRGAPPNQATAEAASIAARAKREARKAVAI